MKERNYKILELYKSGKTLEEIGRIFSFTRSRAQQIIIRELKKNILKKLRLKELTKEELILLDVAVKEEIKEISIERKTSGEKEIKERIRKKIESLPHTKFITVSNYARALGEKADLIKKYFPEIIKEIIQKKKQLWSRYYNKCRICETISVKHASHGLCENCYTKSDIFKDMQEASRMRNSYKWKKRQKEYSEEYKKRPEVIARIKERNDLLNFSGNREKAIKRDDYKCVICGLSRNESYERFQKDLYVKHINGTNNDLENLKTVCSYCFQKIKKR